jgi:acetoin utilization deacetylase AcuC-like enzyme
MSGMLLVEQRAGARALQPWVLNSDTGERLPGHDHDRRLAALRAGLVRHPGVRLASGTRADSDELALALGALHDASFISALAGVDSEEPVLLEGFCAPGMEPDTPVCASVARAAFEGVRTAMSAARAIVAGERFAYALCRPPGHHAGPSWLGGCCYLNNAAAAAYTLRAGGLSPVGILDLDIHYPNGTAAIAARMADVSLCSLHCWPVVNVPTSSAEPCCERERVVEFRSVPEEELYLSAVAESIEALSANAAAIVLSLGYDTVQGDPHGCWRFSPEIFEQVGRLLAGALLPVCVVQEGGYALDSLAACAQAFANGLLAGESA